MDELEFYLADLKSRFAGINPQDYYLSYSGGKDSHFLYWFIKEILHEDRIEIVAINTRMEYPQIMRRMYKYADKVLLPQYTISWVTEIYGTPCFSKHKDQYIAQYQHGKRTDALMSHILGVNPKTGQPTSTFSLSERQRELLLSGKLHKISPACCNITKKMTAHKYERESGKKAILGVRGSEGINRRTQYKSCFTKDRKFTPIYDLSTQLLNEANLRYNIEVPEIYNHIARTGCMGCPYGYWHGDVEKELLLLNDAQRKYVISLFSKSYDVLGVRYDDELFK